VLVVVYRWIVDAGHENAFEQAWSSMTDIIRDRYGGLGSRLHRTTDGRFVAYAQWPDKETLAACDRRIPDADERALIGVMKKGASLVDREEMVVLIDMLVPVQQTKKRGARKSK
jgi:Antibiotic biosynthesis monooxygenase